MRRAVRKAVRRAVRRDFSTGVRTGDRADVYRAVRSDDCSIPSILVLRISGALELRIKLLHVATLFYTTIKLLYNYLLIDNIDNRLKRLYY